jgi:Type 9 secretion system plug protein 1st domain
MRPAINLERFNRKNLTLKNRLPPVVRKVFSGITLSLQEQPRMKYLLLFIGIWIGQNSRAQTPDSVYMTNISSAKLYLKGNQMAYPLLTLNSGDQLELVFDDLDADVKNYYYTYQLCNADWTPVQVSTFDYIRGFAQNQIMDYHYSSLALIRYTHYHLTLPENNSRITLAGNYLLKVYLNNDTSQLAFTRRLMVLQTAVSITARILPPMNPQFSSTHQKLEFTVNSKALSISSPFQQMHVVVLQNERWDNAIYMGNPSFYSGSNFEYNSDETPLFPGGNQWRWIDLQSFRFQSDRIAHVDYLKNGDVITAKPDKDRSGLPYYYYADNNGKYYIQTTDLIDPNWQSDYGRVRFSFVPPDHTPLEGKDVYILGEFTGYRLNDASRMTFNEKSGVYEGSALLKMGFYNYEYVTVNTGERESTPSLEFTEGNHFETENFYEILVYYRALGGRSDQLVGVFTLNSMGDIK